MGVKITIQDLMTRSGVKFGTSGARGLATQMTDRVCYAYTRGFLQYLRQVGDWAGKGAVAVAGDLRPSTERIMAAVCRAVEDAGGVSVHCGRVPSPAVALKGFAERIPSIMVTGSHIPAERNGIKFNKCSGEVLKSDEAGMAAQSIELDESLFDESGALRPGRGENRPVEDRARTSYVRRYLNFFGPDALTGWRVGAYQHSAVGRELLVEVLAGLGAEVTPLGRSEVFVPVDTEALRPEDVRLAREWSARHHFDAIVSTDGDGDRPLLADERGEWLRGDMVGILCARFLGADSVSTPVSSNTALEKSGWFREILRTRIGSPYVVASMQQALSRGVGVVVGYEANGGFLLGSAVRDRARGVELAPLPTRDALLPILACLVGARRDGRTLAQSVGALPQRFTASSLLKDFPNEHGQAVVRLFQREGEAAAARHFGDRFGPLATLDLTDGPRMTFASGEIVHLRPSGNAPEFRCYSESSSAAQAEQNCREALAILQNTVVPEALG
ncbi:MAG TPA: phosphomannomutase [Methylomirabilota bacterium]|nr:phosphomannomutase [Methylomirabilota bacterium]